MLVVVLLLTVGYAAFGDNMSIGGTVATVIPDANIRITSVVASGNNGATVGTTDHGYHYISSSVSMPQNSTITYTVEVTNFGNEPMAIYAINPTYSPNDIKIISTSGYNIGDKICADSNPSQCTLNAVKTFTITIGYNNYGGTQAHEINLDFEFVRTYDVTYSHITNNGYPAVAYVGKPFQVTFSGDVPADIIVSPSHNHTYQNGVLSIPNVTSDITINRYYSITYNLNSGTQANNQVTRYLYGDNLSILDPTRTNYVFQGWYESSTFTGSPVTSTNGLDRNLVLYAKWGVIYSVSYVDITDSNNYPSTIVSGNTYSQTFATAPSSVSVTMGGNTLTSGTDFTYLNGTLTIPNVSGNLVITGVSGGGMGTPDHPYEDNSSTYNPDDIPANSIIVFTAVDGAPKVSTDSNGAITSFEYTNASSSNPVKVTSSSPVSTGFIPFDGSSDWELNMRYKWKWADNTPSGSTVTTTLSCMDWSSGTLKSGFGIRHSARKASSSVTTPKTNLFLNVSTNDTSQTHYLFDANDSGRIYTDPMDFTVHITKIGSTLTFSIKANGSLKYNPTRDNSSSNGVTTTTNEVVTKTWQDNGSNSNVDITIGGYINSSGNMAQKANIDVLEFSVHKIPSS